MLPETHMIISERLCKKCTEKFGINFDINNMKLGAVMPDFHPYYKFKGHYISSSKDFIIGEIIKLIEYIAKIDIENVNKYQIKILSRKIGIISHYLCDFVCLPHAFNWRCNSKDAKNHINYERYLNSVAQNHKFSNIEIGIADYSSGAGDLYVEISSAIDTVVKFYVNSVENGEHDLTLDLNLAYKFNMMIALYAFKAAECYTVEYEGMKLTV